MSTNKWLLLLLLLFSLVFRLKSSLISFYFLLFYTGKKHMSNPRMYSLWPITTGVVNKNQSELKADMSILWQARENHRIKICWAYYPNTATAYNGHKSLVNGCEIYSLVWKNCSINKAGSGGFPLKLTFFRNLRHSQVPLQGTGG